MRWRARHWLARMHRYLHRIEERERLGFWSVPNGYRIQTSCNMDHGDQECPGYPETTYTTTAVHYMGTNRLEHGPGPGV